MSEAGRGGVVARRADAGRLHQPHYPAPVSGIGLQQLQHAVVVPVGGAAEGVGHQHRHVQVADGHRIRVASGGARRASRGPRADAGQALHPLAGLGGRSFCQILEATSVLGGDADHSRAGSVHASTMEVMVGDRQHRLGPGKQWQGPSSGHIATEKAAQPGDRRPRIGADHSLVDGRCRHRLVPAAGRSQPRHAEPADKVSHHVIEGTEAARVVAATQQRRDPADGPFRSQSPSIGSHLATNRSEGDDGSSVRCLSGPTSPRRADERPS